jgi:hypothetical protein
VVVENPLLIFPTKLSESQRMALQRRLAVLSGPLAQQVLDELAGRMQSTSVRNPVGYCGTLIRRARNGTFAPERALAVADARRQSEEWARERAKHEVARLDVLRETPTVPAGPLRDALDRIQRRISAPSSDGDDDRPE